jgi:hypothetical protein
MITLRGRLAAYLSNPVRRISRSRLKTARPSLFPLRRFRKLGQIIGNRKPRCLSCNVYVALRTYSWIIVQASERQSIVHRISVESAQYRRAADPAKAAMGSRRRLIITYEIMSLYPVKICGFRPGARAKRHTMRLAAHRAMTVKHSDKGTLDLIPYPPHRQLPRSMRSSLTSTQVDRRVMDL